MTKDSVRVYLIVAGSLGTTMKTGMFLFIDTFKLLKKTVEFISMC